MGVWLIGVAGSTRPRRLVAEWRNPDTEARYTSSDGLTDVVFEVLHDEDDDTLYLQSDHETFATDYHAFQGTEDSPGEWEYTLPDTLLAWEDLNVAWRAKPTPFADFGPAGARNYVARSRLGETVWIPGGGGEPVGDIIEDLCNVLDGIQPNAGGRVMTFNCVPWGRHFNGDYWPDDEDESILALRLASAPVENRDMGGGAQSTVFNVEVHLWWTDHEDITGPDAWRAAVEAAVTQRIRGMERSIGPAYFTQVVNSTDDTDLLPTGEATSMIRHHLIVSVESFVSEVYG